MKATSATLQAEFAEFHTLDIGVLGLRWREWFKCEPPPFRSKHLLLLAIAYRLQAKRRGDLSIGTKRQMAELTKRFDEPDFNPARRDALASGTALTREWNNVRHIVLAEDGGFRYQDRTYASLTAVAKAITGTHWNGRRFFKLDQAHA